MHTPNKPPRKKKEPPEGPANPKDIRPDRREKPASAERTDVEPEADEKREAPEADTTSRQPITNQDEQDRVTNAGQDRPVPEK